MIQYICKELQKLLATYLAILQCSFKHLRCKHNFRNIKKKQFFQFQLDRQKKSDPSLSYGVSLSYLTFEMQKGCAIKKQFCG